MKLEKAIEILTHPAYRIGIVPNLDFMEALQLGFEALKIIIKERRDLVSYAGELLPGETEEEKET